MAANTQKTAYATGQSSVVRAVNPGQQQFAIAGQQPYPALVGNQDPRHKYKKTLRGLGIAECIIGGLSVLLAVIANSIASSELRRYAAYRGYYYANYVSIGFTMVSQGIWCGIVVMVTGILGIREMNTPSRCMYVANMTMGIITACITFSGTVMSGLAAGLSTLSGIMVFLHSIITILCFAAVIISIIHSAFCCSGVCASSSSVANQQPMYYPQQFTGQSQPQYVHGPNGQLVMVVNQPMLPSHTATQASAFQQASVTTSPIRSQMPSTSTQKAEGTYENVFGKAPPTYYPRI